MPRLSRPFASLLIAPALCAAQGEAVFPDETWEVAAPQEQGLDPELLAQAVARLGEVCGHDGAREVVVVRRGRVVWAGPEIDRRRPVWSCTKSFLGTCLVLLWDDGLCSPETRAASVLPELEQAYAELTLGQLAGFTGGYATASERQGDVSRPAPPLHPPGAAMHYGRQSDLLALLLTRIAAEPLRELFMRRVGRPIGIAEDQLEWGLQDIPGEPVAVHGGTGVPPAGVAISARAMARFAWLWCQGGMWDGERLLAADHVAHATGVRVPATVPAHDPAGWYTVLPGHYGLNWWVNGEPDAELVWPSLPASSFAVQGNRNNIGVIVPEWELVFVRLGDDPAVDARGYDAAFALLRQALVAGGGLPPDAR